MEQVDIDNILKEIFFTEIKYFVSYEEETGKILCFGPALAFKDVKNKIELDDDTANLIIRGKVFLQSCLVNLKTLKLDINVGKEEKTIDNILYKIPIKNNLLSNSSDLCLFYYSESMSLDVVLNSSYQRTDLIKKYNLLDKKLELILSDYNDPNNIHRIIIIPFKDLIGNKITINDIFFDKNLSIYTKKIFIDYALEIK